MLRKKSSLLLRVRGLRRCFTAAKLNLPETTFPMHPNPAAIEPSLQHRLAREHYAWQVRRHRFRMPVCSDVAVCVLVAGAGADVGGALHPA